MISETLAKLTKKTLLNAVNVKKINNKLIKCEFKEHVENINRRVEATGAEIDLPAVVMATGPVVVATVVVVASAAVAKTSIRLLQYFNKYISETMKLDEA